MARIWAGLLALAIAGTLPSCFFMDIDPRSIPPQRPAAGMIGIAGYTFDPGEDVKVYGHGTALGEPVKVTMVASRGSFTEIGPDEKTGTTFRWQDGGPDAGLPGIVRLTTKATGPKGTQTKTMFLEIEPDGSKRLRDDEPQLGYYVPKYPVALAFDKAGAFWVLGAGSSDLTRLSPAGKVLGKTPIEKYPNAMALDVAGNAWVVNREAEKAMTKISPTGELIGHFPLPRSGEGVAFDAEGNAWVATDDGIYRMAPDGKDLGLVFEGDVAAHAIDASGTAWIAFTKAADRGQGATQIARVATTGTFEVLGTAEGGQGPAAIAFDADGNAWITNEQGGDVTKLSPAGAVLGTYPVGKSPRGIACDGEGNAWVVVTVENVVAKLSAAGKLLGRYEVGGSPSGAIAFAPDGVPWATAASNGRVMRIDRLVKAK